MTFNRHFPRPGETDPYACPTSTNLFIFMSLLQLIDKGSHLKQGQKETSITVSPEQQACEQSQAD